MTTWRAAGLPNAHTSDDPTTKDASEANLGATFVGAMVRASDTLSGDVDPEANFRHLIDVCVQLCPGTEASVLLVDGAGNLAVAHASTDRKRLLEQFQIDHSYGPSIETLRDETSADSWDEADLDHWPRFAQLARTMGFHSIRSVPLRHRNDTIGVLSVAGPTEIVRETFHDSLVLALADCTTIGVLNRRTYAASNLLSQQLQSALTTRVQIEQAKGVASTRLGLTVDEAFALLRDYARRSNRKLIDVSRGVVDGVIATHDLWPSNRRGVVAIPSGAGIERIA